MKLQLLSLCLLAYSAAAESFHYYNLPTKATTNVWVAGREESFVFCEKGLNKDVDPIEEKYYVSLKNSIFKRETKVPHDQIKFEKFADTVSTEDSLSDTHKFKSRLSKGFCWLATFTVPETLKTANDYRLRLKAPRNLNKWNDQDFNKSPKFDIVNENEKGFFDYQKMEENYNGAKEKVKNLFKKEKESKSQGEPSNVASTHENKQE